MHSHYSQRWTCSSPLHLQAYDRLCGVYGGDHSLTQWVEEVCEEEQKAEELLEELLPGSISEQT